MTGLDQDAPERRRGDRAFRGWRGPLLAALVAMLCGLPGVFGLPPLDRDEARYAQATAQMIESGDYVNIRFQDQPRHKKPVGIHWLQATSVRLLSSAEARDIRAYRVPSLLGAMLAAAACAWGAAAFFGARAGFVAGAVLAATFLLSSEASIAKTDAALCGAIVLMQASLARVYRSARSGGRAHRRHLIPLWLAMAAAVLIKGPVGPLVFALTLAGLWVADREVRWAGRLGWTWGLGVVLLVVGPWAAAVTVQTDGAFWREAVGGDIASKLVGADERHGGWPGLHLAVLPILFFPAALVLPAAAVAGWRERANPGVRFALAWLLPAWLLFELVPTKLVHYPLPLYAALAWLVAAALARPFDAFGRLGGVVLSLLSGAGVAAACVHLLARFGAQDARAAGVLAACFAAAAGLVGAIALLRRLPLAALAGAGVLGAASHGMLALGLIPRLEPLQLSPRAAEALAAAGLDPREGLAPGPVAVAGYAEPSVVFLLGTATGLGGATEAAAAVAEGRPALVEAAVDAAFQRELRQASLRARAVATVSGFNYSRGAAERLTLYRRQETP
jgi:4-amino-4-deoxy-L-arabinose transferase-like glycosyltransferase